MSSQSFEFSCSLASLAAHAVAQPRYLRSVSCRCRVAVELVSLVSLASAGKDEGGGDGEQTITHLGLLFV